MGWRGERAYMCSRIKGVGKAKSLTSHIVLSHGFTWEFNR